MEKVHQYNYRCNGIKSMLYREIQQQLLLNVLYIWYAWGHKTHRTLNLWTPDWGVITRIHACYHVASLARRTTLTLKPDYRIRWTCSSLVFYIPLQPQSARTHRHIHFHTGQNQLQKIEPLKSILITSRTWWHLQLPVDSASIRLYSILEPIIQSVRWSKYGVDAVCVCMWEGYVCGNKSELSPQH